ncbi:hypothetical protein MSAN_02108500 [Mycena sanguinolenta]|uniref:Uncharacterized protein n=1 Tax=Mycena sanguinolenta TaxID=230812 RepID=A0A8H7CK90_9AGAR|nr:hypothetical protein MSAN_02108500 [Mycena sanguinolenta]
MIAQYVTSCDASSRHLFRSSAALDFSNMPLPPETDEHDRQLIIAFLEEWRATGPAEPNKTRLKHGELKQIRSMLRDRYAQHRVGSHFNFNTIRFAMETRPEWDEWREQLFGERAAKNAEKKRAKVERAEQKAKKKRSLL